ncbi:MAG: hypothetical protein IKO22_04175 [Oscillospiraceae bacterium]|nr:hypothetical protein [Oscillospiraceae bacterium]
MPVWKDIAKHLAEDALGKESVNALSNLGKTAIDVGSKATAKIYQTINKTDCPTIVDVQNDDVKNSSNNNYAEDLQNAGNNTRTVIQDGDKGNNLFTATCPNCGASLEVYNGIDTLCCQYCGTKVIINNQSDATIKAKESIKRIEHKEVMADKILNHLKARSEQKAIEREKQRKESNKIILALVAVLVVCFSIILINSHNNKAAEQEQDARFQEIVLSIEEDIKNEDYDAALIKANQLYLVTKTPIGNDLKKKWDSTRIALIKQIEELQDKKKASDALTPAPKTYEEASAALDSTNNIATVHTGSGMSVNYSTNDRNTVKNGNTGVYAYKSRGGSYAIYYIIDFDSGYVFYFTDGNGEETCERVKIDSGDLNSVLKITYHDNGDTWQYGLHFNWKNMPDTLVVQDPSGYEDKFYTTDLDASLLLRNKKSIKDY